MGGVAAGDAQQGTQDPVLLWNRVALRAHVIDHTPAADLPPGLPGAGAFRQTGPTATSRAFGMVQGAVFDAVNSIDRVFTSYLLTQTFGSFADRRAAVAQATRDTLVNLYPGQQSSLDEALRRYLAGIPNGPAENEGIRAGRAAATVMINARANDGSNAPMPYTPSGLPGGHNVDPLNPGQGFLGSRWGLVTPFTMNRAGGGGTAAFRPGPPPALTSAPYTAAFNEVRVVGAEDAETRDRDGNGVQDRTRAQTIAGIYWAYDGSRRLGTPPRLYNQIVQTIAVQRNNSLLQNARLFALVNLAMADSGISSWDTKYVYDHWRPILGIRQANTDGNPNTVREAGWRPLGAQNTNAPPGSINFTPNFPAYSSGHATFGAALFQTLIRFYGNANSSFTFVSDEFNGVNRDVNGQVRPRIPRTFASFDVAREENGQSRIYLGIHWAYDKTSGIAEGNQIANHVFNNFLRPRNTLTTASVSGFTALEGDPGTGDVGTTDAAAVPAAAPGDGSGTGRAANFTQFVSATLVPAPGSLPTAGPFAAPAGEGGATSGADLLSGGTAAPAAPLLVVDSGTFGGAGDEPAATEADRLFDSSAVTGELFLVL